jgi:hypothetical protein
MEGSNTLANTKCSFQKCDRISNSVHRVESDAIYICNCFICSLHFNRVKFITSTSVS